ncbi:MAG TPA: hypothetical protein VKM35_05955 [Arenimonas sp.]|uniref:hypothetical protein n=1 Tax=Arenimonas sp. TaxID=1872635 RepID=UPI002C029C56|nr:hypothetical protein [Arenimonas sp.]HMB56734.1 hypothetical protein [Arenimonas sp.]
MSSPSDQARAALQALRAGKGLDISKLPEPMRQKLQAQLDKLPPEMRAELLEKGSPILDRALDKIGQHASTNIKAPTHPNLGHYNGTVQPGDRMHLSLGTIILAIAAAFALSWFWGH